MFSLKEFNMPNVSKMCLCLTHLMQLKVPCFASLHYQVLVSLFVVTDYHFILLQMLPSKDANFVGYTYKNFEIVSEDHIPGIGLYQPL